MTAERHPGVDTPVALEFTKEILLRLDRPDMAAIAAALSAKSDWLRASLGAGEPAAGDGAAYRLLRSFFPSRRRASDIVGALGGEQVLRSAGKLVGEHGPLAERLERFGREMHPFDDVASDLAWELLHAYDPTRYWLWNRWVWNPRTETGALRLLVAEEVDLWDDEPVGTYMKVGAALAVVQDNLAALGAVDDATFGMDVFLASVYGVYMYTVLRMRMSQEFNRIVPELPSLARRLLGVNDSAWEERSCR